MDTPMMTVDSTSLAPHEGMMLVECARLSLRGIIFDEMLGFAAMWCICVTWLSSVWAWSFEYSEAPDATDVLLRFCGKYIEY